MDDKERLAKAIEKAKCEYSKQQEIWCPYFQCKITLNSDGFNHLQYKKNRQLRNVSEQLLKLNLLPIALEIIRKSGTLQEYRAPVFEKIDGGKNGFCKAKKVEYWAFHSIFGRNNLKKVCVILKRIGDGKIAFWSVMPHRKFNNKKLYDEGIDDD